MAEANDSYDFTNMEEESNVQRGFNIGQELREWNHGMKYIGMPPHTNIRTVISGLMKKIIKKDRSPEGNAIHEAAMAKTGIDPEDDCDILEEMGEEFFVDNVNDEENLEEAAAIWGDCQPDEHDKLPLPTEPTCNHVEAHNIKRVTRLATVVSRCRETEGKAVAELAKIIEEHPTMADLAKLLIPSVVNLPATTKAQTATTNDTIHPASTVVDRKRIYMCPVCNADFNSWAKADQHIREVHTLVKYGPCPYCAALTTFNVDSYRHHTNKRCHLRPKKDE